MGSQLRKEGVPLRCRQHLRPTNSTPCVTIYNTQAQLQRRMSVSGVKNATALCSKVSMDSLSARGQPKIQGLGLFSLHSLLNFLHAVITSGLAHARDAETPRQTKQSRHEKKGRAPCCL